MQMYQDLWELLQYLMTIQAWDMILCLLMQSRKGGNIVLKIDTK